MKKTIAVTVRIVFWTFLGMLLAERFEQSHLIGAVAGCLVGVLFNIIALKPRTIEKSSRTLKYSKVILYIFFFVLILFFMYMALATTVFLNWPADELLGIWGKIAFLALLVSLIVFVLYVVIARKKNV